MACQITHPTGKPGGLSLGDLPLEAEPVAYLTPATGQFLSVDPDVQQTLETFLYAADDPVNAKDLNGLVGVPACAYNGSCPGPAYSLPSWLTNGWNWFVDNLEREHATLGQWAGWVKQQTVGDWQYLKVHMGDIGDVASISACIASAGSLCIAAIALAGVLDAGQEYIAQHHHIYGTQLIQLACLTAANLVTAGIAGKISEGLEPAEGMARTLHVWAKGVDYLVRVTSTASTVVVVISSANAGDS